eukprot:460533-Prymnesium_polylepis.1
MVRVAMRAGETPTCRSADFIVSAIHVLVNMLPLLNVKSGVFRRSSPLTGKASSSCCSCLAAL